MPLINFSTPVMEKTEMICNDDIIQIDVDKNFEKRKIDLEEDEKEEIKDKEKYIKIKENELLEKEEMLKKKEEKLKLIVRAMVAKDEEIKRKEAYLLKYIPKI